MADIDAEVDNLDFLFFGHNYVTQEQITLIQSTSRMWLIRG